MTTNVIVPGDALKILRTLPDACVDMVMTSPPYWALRDYGSPPLIWDGELGCKHDWTDPTATIQHRAGETNPGKEAWYKDAGGANDKGNCFCKGCGAWKGSLGLEPSPELYVKHLCDIFDEVRRVLVPQGTCWVNMGDTHKNKNLLQIPSHFAIEMQKRGWLLRNEVIWHKPNCMPCSATDRFTIDFEKVYFFAKSPKYFYKTQYEPLAAATLERNKYSREVRNGKARGYGRLNGLNDRDLKCEGARIKRCVWRISPKRFKGAHFATYPPELCQIPISAGCPDCVCRSCGQPRQTIWEKTKHICQADRVAYKKTKKCGERLAEVNTAPTLDHVEQYREVGLTDCGCGVGFRSGVVLDPFFGSGSTGLAALQQDKCFIGIELNPQYVEIAEERLRPYLFFREPEPTFFSE